MRHKEKDILIGNLVDKNVSLKKRVDYLEGKKYDDKINELQNIIDLQDDNLKDKDFENESLFNTTFIYLADIRELYKRLDSKNEDIQILNTLINK
tara:strand:+ start:54 stop:338 length:285 start_codon:yes stop_codon:yes gene_type:complete